MSNELNFYTLPFHQAKYGTWVYDAKGNFIFEFETTVSKEDSEKVINSLNGGKMIMKGHNLSYDKDDTMILLDGEYFISIRGWGNLTGIGANNFPAEKAAKIQDDLAVWIIDKLRKNP